MPFGASADGMTEGVHLIFVNALPITAVLFPEQNSFRRPRTYPRANTRRTKESAMPSTRCMPASEKPWPSPANTSISAF